MVAPPTPPLTENDTLQLSSGHSTTSLGTSSSLEDANPTVYHNVFPTISNLAIQKRLAELVDLAENTELNVDSRSRVHQSRLLLVAPLALSYIILNGLPQARISLTRLPENLASHTLTRSLLKLVAATQYRNYPLIYKSIEEILALVQESFFDASLAAVIKLLLERYTYDFRRKTSDLIARTYTAISTSLVGSYLNVPEDDARISLEQLGWTFGSATNQLSPPSAKRQSGTSPASSLSTVRHVIEGTAQIESSVSANPWSASFLLSLAPSVLLLQKTRAQQDFQMTTSDNHDSRNDIIEEMDGIIVDTQPVSEESGPPEVWIKLKFTWAGKNYDISVAESDRVYDLKSLIFSVTNVPPDRQKILGLVKGKVPPEQEAISNLKLAPGKKFSLVGTPLGDELKDPSKVEELPDVFNDLDVDFSENPEASRAYIADRRNQRKIREATQRLRESLTLMHPLREGKKLLVLDIDYTILDTKPLLEGSLPPIECARPRLHEFLEAVYPHYDICVWSQTSWIWLETKLHELGMIGSERNRYKINFGAAVFRHHPLSLLTPYLVVLDKTCMFKVFSVRNGQQFPHHVKPLKIIWNLFPQYDASNTIHVDDLSRNFALNPGEGLKISAFKEAHTLRAIEDRELEKLTRYLVHIATVADLKTVDHKDWKKIAKALQPPDSEPQ